MNHNKEQPANVEKASSEEPGHTERDTYDLYDLT